MIVVDVNLLLYAVISGFPKHSESRAWWEDTLNSRIQVGLAAPALFGFLRVSTNPRVFTTPLSVERATGYVRQWLAHRSTYFLQPGPRHLDIAFDLLQEVGAAGSLTTDVQLAALAIENQAELHSNDTDFARFPQLRWVNPLAT